MYFICGFYIYKYVFVVKFLLTFVVYVCINFMYVPALIALVQLFCYIYEAQGWQSLLYFMYLFFILFFFCFVFHSKDFLSGFVE